MFRKIFCVSALAVACSPAGMAQQPAGPYTATQSANGRAIYQANCSGCHAADLSGLNSASALAGGLFMSSWGDRTTGDLITFLEGAMPPGNPGSLGQAAYVDVTAFILDFNGAQPGRQPLTSAARTRAPSSANRTATARPIPEPAPVTRATFPARRPGAPISALVGMTIRVARR